MTRNRYRRSRDLPRWCVAAMLVGSIFIADLWLGKLLAVCVWGAP